MFVSDTLPLFLFVVVLAHPTMELNLWNETYRLCGGHSWIQLLPIWKTTWV